MRRILYTITVPDVGGAQVHVLSLIEAFRAEYDVHLATSSSGPLTDAAQQAGATTHIIPELTWRISPRDDYAAVGRLARLIRDTEPALVHAHSSKAGILTRLACRLATVPAVFTAHGWAFSEGIGVARRMMALVMERIASPWATRIICVSEYDYRLAIRFGIGRPHQMQVIYNGVDREAPLAALHARRRPLLATVARFCKQKDHASLLEAFAMLAPRKAELLLVGGGEGRAATQQLARSLGLGDSVVFAGERSDVPELLATASAFVLSTNWEGLPISIIEAMRAGLPVVATDVGGVSELIRDGCTGLLVPRRDPRALMRALQQLINDAQARREMGRAGRDRFLSHFTLESMVQEVGQLYKELTDGQ